MSANNALLQTASDKHIRATLTALCRRDRKLEREALTMLAHLDKFEAARLQAKGSQQKQQQQVPQNTAAGVKRKMPTQDDNGAEICVECGAAFDSQSNGAQACQMHEPDAETHPDYEGDFWADHDEKCHGVIDSAELREEYPDGYIWDCCGETGSHPGCMRGPHKSRFDPVGRTGP